MRNVTRLRHDDSGTAVVEAVWAAMALGALLLLLMAGGRVVVARQAVEATAAQSARAASIARTQNEARVAAEGAATTGISEQGLRCVTSQVIVDVSEFAAPAGTPASVQVTVRCQVDLSDLTAIPGMPGSVDVSATAQSPLDTYRER
jgi:Flp pilus assembly protein TadG